jgi:hypothetical protein
MRFVSGVPTFKLLLREPFTYVSAHGIGNVIGANAPERPTSSPLSASNAAVCMRVDFIALYISINSIFQTT